MHAGVSRVLLAEESYPALTGGWSVGLPTLSPGESRSYDSLGNPAATIPWGTPRLRFPGEPRGYDSLGNPAATIPW
eukprot:1195052-Prorocentrum_minimum.AAC.5